MCVAVAVVPGQLASGPDRETQHGDEREQAHTHHSQRSGVRLRQLQLRGRQQSGTRQEVHGTLRWDFLSYSSDWEQLWLNYSSVNLWWNLLAQRSKGFSKDTQQFLFIVTNYKGIDFILRSTWSGRIPKHSIQQILGQLQPHLAGGELSASRRSSASLPQTCGKYVLHSEYCEMVTHISHQSCRNLQATPDLNALNGEFHLVASRIVEMLWLPNRLIFYRASGSLKLPHPPSFL